MASQSQSNNHPNLRNTKARVNRALSQPQQEISESLKTSQNEHNHNIIPTHSDLSCACSEELPGANPGTTSSREAPPPPHAMDSNIQQLMQSQTKFILGEMNKMLSENQESLKATMDVNIDRSTTQISQSLGSQLTSISSNLSLLQNKVDSLETSMSTRI